MNKSALVMTVAVLLAALLAPSCSDDLIIPPPPSLEGNYAGTYLVVTGYNLANPDTTVSPVSFRFSQERYWFTAEKDSADELRFCSPSGLYVLRDIVTFDESIKNCANVTATERFNPRGDFSIRRPDDSVIMLQAHADTLKQVLLKRLP